MHLTERTDIGLRILLFLAAHEARTPVSAIAQAFRLSPTHVAKVAQGLSKAGFAVTVAGRQGGIELARPAAAITVGEVVRALEPMALVDCMSSTPTCPISSQCALEIGLVRAREAFLEVLDELTLAGAARGSARGMKRLLPAALLPDARSTTHEPTRSKRRLPRA